MTSLKIKLEPMLMYKKIDKVLDDFAQAFQSIFSHFMVGFIINMIKHTSEMELYTTLVILEKCLQWNRTVLITNVYTFTSNVLQAHMYR